MRPVTVIAALVMLAGCAHRDASRPSEFIVFFHPGSPEIAPEFTSVLDEAAAAIRGSHPGSVAIAAGVAVGDNLQLAEPRFAAVQRALMARGVPEAILARSSLPDAKLNVGPTGDQRVEILLLARRPD